MMGEKTQLGRYGENPHQVAWAEKDDSYKGPTVLNEPLHGIDTGYNNLLDANAALNVILDLQGKPGVVIVKHQNPCGIATGETLGQAFEHAWRGDEVSSFGSIVGYSQEVDEAAAKALQGRFVEVTVAPSYSESAIKWIKSHESKKERLRVIPTGPLGNAPKFTEEHAIRGGKVSQTADDRLYLCESIEQLVADPQTLKELNSGLVYQVGNVTQVRFNPKMGGLVEFATLAGKHTKSNAIILAHEYAPGQYKVLGMGAGQPNRMDSGRKLALPKALENLMRQYAREQSLDYPMTMDRMLQDPRYAADLTRKVEEYSRTILSSEKVVLFSDAFFPKRDGLVAAAELGVKYIVAPGGSKEDPDVIKAADELGVAMVFTGIRHFKH